MYALVFRHTSDPAILEQVQFPLESAGAAFRGRTTLVKSERDLLRRFQPYTHPGEPGFPLLLLQDLSNIDKHSYLNIVRPDVTAYTFNWFIGNSMRGRISQPQDLQVGKAIEPFSPEGIELAGADIPSVQFPHHCNLASIDIGNLRVNFV